LLAISSSFLLSAINSYQTLIAASKTEELFRG